MLNFIKRLFREEEGQGMVEYALIIVGVALVVFLAFPTVTDALSDLFTRIATELSGPPTP